MAVTHSWLRPSHVVTYPLFGGGTVTVNYSTNSTVRWVAVDPAAEVEQDIREEDKAMTASLKKAEIHPVSPKKGAYIRRVPTGEQTTTEMRRFNEWKDDTTFTTLESEDTMSSEEWEALTPALYGLSYDRACGLPPSGYGGMSMEVTGWRGIEVIVRLAGRGSNTALLANALGACAPMLNPETEKPEEAMVRLQREKDNIEFGLRARMVAEGVARNWCSEFDPILDATGLAPRKSRGWISGTATFRVELTGYDLTDEATVEAIRANPGAYISAANYKMETLEVDPHINAPMLST